MIIPNNSKESSISDIYLEKKILLSKSGLDLLLFICVFQGVQERHESKVLRLQLELSETKAELERKLSEKDEEMETFRYVQLF